MSAVCLIMSILCLRYFENSFPIIYEVYQVSKNNGLTKGLKYNADVKEISLVYTLILTIPK